MDLQLHLGNEPKAIELAEKTIQNQNPVEVSDQWIQAIIFLPLFKAGRLEDAAAVQKSAFRKFGTSDRNPDLIGKHISYLSVTGQFDKAFAVFERHLKSAIDIAMERGKVEFLIAARYMCESYLRSLQEPDAVVSFELPPQYEKFEPTGKYSIQKLSHWFALHAKQLVDAFNSRNGNEHFSFIMNQTMELERFEKSSTR